MRAAEFGGSAASPATWRRIQAGLEACLGVAKRALPALRVSETATPASGRGRPGGLPYIDIFIDVGQRNLATRGRQLDAAAQIIGGGEQHPPADADRTRL